MHTTTPMAARRQTLFSISRRNLAMRDLTLGVQVSPPVLPGVWNRILASPRRLLLLDYDGTLAPFQVDRERALPSPRVRDALRAVAMAGEPVVVISGRPVAQLLKVLHGIPLHLIGEHGWEELTATGGSRVYELPHTTEVRLGLAHRAALACGWQQHLERKRTAIVLHTRALPREQAGEIEQNARDLWARFFERDGLRLDEVDGGLELRATHRGKGTVAWETLQSEPHGTLPVYVGDDATDEEAFRTLRPLGVTIRVGRPHLPSAAEWRLASVDDVASFLEHWRAVVPGNDA
jgi:trehalose 6-phosphate phosphatase